MKTQDHFDSFRPVLNDYVLPDDVYELYQAGRFNDTPLLLGSNSEEGRMLAPPAATPASFEAQTRALFGSHGDTALALYPHATDAEAEQSARDEISAGMGWEAWAWARLSSRKGPDKVFLYYFDRHSPQAPRGPTHGAEIAYVFGNLGIPGSGLSGSPGPADVPLAEQIQDYWVNFAKTGNPNGPGLPYWPAFSVSSPRVMYLDAHPRAGPVPNMKQIKAFDAYYAHVRQAEAQKKPAQ